uniref:Uncharacterized protein n=1 Tax=Nelumbo nucifera TaxID=4432 RepID=A0A822YIW5_NELNU|nr:TPA_asm: hypothetical protein HUJ06_009756 [Nelumbo nucifera]
MRDRERIAEQDANRNRTVFEAVNEYLSKSSREIQERKHGNGCFFLCVAERLLGD